MMPQPSYLHFSYQLSLKFHRNVLSIKQARTLLKSLVIIGALNGVITGAIGTSVPWLFPNLFTPDPAIISEVIWKFLTKFLKYIDFLDYNLFTPLILYE